MAKVKTWSVILPSLVDRYRTKRDGKRRYTGQVLLFSGKKRIVIAEVYGDTAKEMRQRKHAVHKALLALAEST